MLLERRDIEILRLAGTYRWLPFEGLGAFGVDNLNDEIVLLGNTGLISIAASKQYFKLSPQGYEFMNCLGYSYKPGAKRAFAASTALRRRLEVANIMLTCRRAGIDTLPDGVDSLRGQPVFFPAFALRTSGMNLMNAANCAGFGHWGDKAYMLQYVSPESCGMSLNNELQHLHNLASVFSRGLNTPEALIFAGPGYKQVYEQLHGTAHSPRRKVKGFYDFGEVYRQTDIPIHLLSCDETGATQLALMCQPDHNAKIARTAFGDRWQPKDAQIPEADGCVGGAPLVIAADMDIRRLEKVCQAAARLKRPEVMAAALGSQMRELLMEVLQCYGNVTLLSIEPVLEAAFGKSFSLHNMDSSPATDAKGGVIHV